MPNYRGEFEKLPLEVQEKKLDEIWALERRGVDLKTVIYKTELKINKLLVDLSGLDEKCQGDIASLRQTIETETIAGNSMRIELTKTEEKLRELWGEVLE